MGDFVEPEEVAGFAQSDLDRYTCELLIRGTEAAARRAVGWNITEETVTDQVPESGWIIGGLIFLPTLNLTALAVTESSTLLTVGTGYTWTRSGVVTRLYSCWSPLWQAISLTYTHGYPVGHSALDDVKDVIGSAVARRIGNPEVLASYTVGGVSETYATGPQLPSVALTMIEKNELREAVGLAVVA